MAEDTPALLDRVIDSSHRSFLAVVQRVKLNVLRPRPPAELIPVDPRWVPRWYVVGLCFWEYVCFVYVSYIMYLPLIVLLFRLSEAGLLTIGRLAESGLAKLDRSLLTALVDRWRPETHLPPPLWGDVTDPTGRCDTAGASYQWGCRRASRCPVYVVGRSRRAFCKYWYRDWCRGAPKSNRACQVMDPAVPGTWCWWG